MQKPLLEIQNLSIYRGGKRILNIPHLAVWEGEVLAVVGPNGAGKSTLLLAISRVIKIDDGQILFRNQELSSQMEKAYRRRIGLVLQEPLLLDANVFDNVATGLRFRHLPKTEIKNRVDLWMERLGIAALRNRSARTLSGGEAQRVSLARAFALQTDLLLLDEPFSALDTPTRTALLMDFQSLIASTNQTAIFITHDLDEALMLGNRVAVIIGGELRQVGKPEDIFSAPADSEIAAFVGVETILPGLAVSVQEGLVTIQAGNYQLEAVGTVNPGRPVYVCLRPEDVTIWRESEAPISSARNRLAGQITNLVVQGALVRVVVDCGLPIVALVTRASAREMGLKPGQNVTVSFKASAVHLIPH